MLKNSRTPIRFTRRRLLAAGAGALAVSALPAGLCLSGCASTDAADAAEASLTADVQPLGQDSFEAYVRDTREWIAKRRHFVTANRALELDRNTPSETRPDPDAIPTAEPLRGILLIHGLGDSPWSFTDVAPRLAQAGILARTVLLPGCGTRPEDMVKPTADDWRRVVREQSEILRRDLTAEAARTSRPGAEVWLGGFSTGCNLALEFAAQNAWIAGLVLFSPAFAVRTRLSFLATLAAPVMTWLRSPEKSLGSGQTALKYTTVPVDGLAAFVSTMDAAQDALEDRAFDRPAILAMSERDSVVDTQAVLREAARRFTSPASRFLWYGAEYSGRDLSGSDPRLRVLADRIESERITSFSHMALTYSPENPEYGRRGESRLCIPGDAQKGARPSAEACLRAGPEGLWYGAWGDPHRSSESRAAGGAYARLTFNPWFEAQMRMIVEVMTEAAKTAPQR